jgi:soluble lytic murein transglycosylase-like protein
MRTTHIRVALAVLSAAVVSLAQAPANAHAGADSALARQRAAAASMDASLARQRSSVEKQAAQAERGPFFAMAPAAASAADCGALPPAEVDSLVQKAADRQDLDKDMLRAVIRQESAFRPCAVSPKGAMGLMQLMPATAIQLGVPDPFDPAQNVEAGATFLKQLLERYGGDLTMALGAYNAGPAKVDAAGGVPKIPETEDYVKQILSNLPVKQ